MPKTFILALALFALAGCPAEKPTPSPVPSQISREELQREKEQRIQVEIQRDTEKSSREQWQTLTALSCVAAIILLLVGTILGSKTRSDAERRQ